MGENFELYADEVRKGLEADAREAALPRLATVSAAELQRRDIPPIRWIVKDLVPAGLTILASPPKFGKSWLAMDLCLSVAEGKRFLGFQTVRGGCLYLALEDSARRLKSRMERLLGSAQAPGNFDFATDAPFLKDGLTQTLERYLQGSPALSLIVLDTLQKVRGLSGGRDVYGQDYADIGALKRFADQHNIALLVVHHLRKAGDDADPFARIAGTNGLSGAADTMLVLSKEKREADTASLAVTGRDVEQTQLVLRFDKRDCVWENMGDADTFAQRTARQAYLDSPVVRTVKWLLEQNPEGWTGTAQQLLNAGTYATRSRLAVSPRDLGAKLKELGDPLFQYDGILCQRQHNGTGGGKYHFSRQQPDAFQQTEWSL